MTLRSVSWLISLIAVTLVVKLAYSHSERPADDMKLVAVNLEDAGAELQAVTLEPRPPQPASATHSFSELLEPDPRIQTMIDQVISTTVGQVDGGLSGEWPVIVGGKPYTIATRYTYSGEPIQTATQYVSETLSSLGMQVEYHQWGGVTYPNVIGEITGEINPGEVYIISAHLDSTSDGSVAPGADDNASGSTAVLIAADILSQYRWGCTLRFALWTGEEQGLLGSRAYAQHAFTNSQNIAGVLNLDMIGWNTPGSSPEIDLHATPSISATLSLAQLFADVIATYNLNLIPQIFPSGIGRSDHASFWSYGYPAILAIEDLQDFNPNYHSVQDRLTNLDMTYFTNFVKASVATLAHMSNCLFAGAGWIDGHVTSTSDGGPLVGATVNMQAVTGGATTGTDADGYYTQTLPVGTYSVTVAATGYHPVSVSSVAVLTDTVTTQDFALIPYDTYYFPLILNEN